MSTTFQWQGANEREDGTVYDNSERHGYNVIITGAGDPVPDIDTTPLYTAIGTEDGYSLDYSLLGAKLNDGDYLFYVQDNIV